MGTCCAAMDNADAGNFTHQPVKEIKYKQWITGLGLSPDGSTLAVGYGSDKIQTVSTNGWGNQEDFEGCCFSRMNSNYINVAFTADSKVVYRWNELVRVRTLDGSST